MGSCVSSAFTNYFYPLCSTGFNSLREQLNQKQYKFNIMDDRSNMGFFFDYYPYFMNPPPFYSIQPPFPLDYFKKMESKEQIKIEEERRPNLKMEEPDPAYIKVNPKQAKSLQQPLKKARSEPKKTQSDSFTQKRNIIPNNINHILAFLQRKSKSERYVKMLINKHGGMGLYSSNKFFCYQQHLKEKLHIHVNKQSLTKLINHLDQCSQIFSLEEQKFYNRMSRILIYFYLRQIAKITILSSGRVKQTSKKDHLNAQRELIRHITDRDQSS